MKNFETFIGGSGNLYNIGNIWCQLGKEWNRSGCTDPAADVAHQHRVLVTKTYKTTTRHKPMQKVFNDGINKKAEQVDLLYTACI